MKINVFRCYKIFCSDQNLQTSINVDFCCFCVPKTKLSSAHNIQGDKHTDYTLLGRKKIIIFVLHNEHESIHKTITWHCQLFLLERQTKIRE